MKLSPLAKIGIAIGAVIGSILFLIVVDLGVNAGRIHYGVSVAGEDLGGMTRVEARKALIAPRDRIKDQVILLTAEGLNVGVTPEDLGWEPNKAETLRVAYDVGRRDAPFGALADRVSSWLWGTKVGFQGTIDEDVLDERMDDWDERLTALGKPLDRDALRALLERAIARGETGPFDFPVDRS